MEAGADDRKVFFLLITMIPATQNPDQAEIWMCSRATATKTEHHCHSPSWLLIDLLLVVIFFVVVFYLFFDIANRRSFFSTGSPSPSSFNSFCCCGCFSRCFCHKNEGRKGNRIEVSSTTDKVRYTWDRLCISIFRTTSHLTKSGDAYY